MSPDTEREQMTIEPRRVYEISYACRDIGYGVESGILDAFWSGEIDYWGKYTIVPIDGSDPLYLFADEITSIN